MRKAAGKVLIGLGIVLVLAAVLWWALAPSALVKIPKDIDTVIYYEGEYTWYVHPVTFEPLPEGQETTVPLEIRLNLLSEEDQYDSDTALISGSVESEVGGIEMKPAPFALALDRRNMMNQADPRAYVLSPHMVVDRSGSLSYAFPFGTSRDGQYSVWKEEIAQPVKVEFIGEEEKEGLTVYDFRGAFENQEVAMAYIEFLGLPAALDFGQFEDILKEIGFDVDDLLALAGQRLSPEDLQALNQAFSQEMPLIYYWSSYTEYSVEPATGVIVDGYKNVESVNVKPDLAALADIAAILMKYQQDPVLGPALQRLASMATQFDDYEGQKLVRYEFKQTEESKKKSIEDAKKGRAAITFVKIYLPVFALAAGVILLITGIILLLAGSRSGKEQTKVEAEGPEE